MEFTARSVIVAAKAYIYYQWFNYLDSKKYFFVSKLKRNTRVKVLESYLTDKNQKHIFSDRDVKLTGVETAQKYQKNSSIAKV